MSNKLITHYMLHFFNNKIQHIVTFRGLGLLKFFYQFISPSLLILMHLKVLEKKLRKIKIINNNINLIFDIQTLEFYICEQKRLN